MITKQEAVKVVTKFGMHERKAKHLFYKLVWNGRTILTTAVPKGKGPLNCRDKFRNQLELSESQLEEAVACPFKREHLISHLKNKGLIPDEDDEA
jgi:hypothetical protein